MGGIMRKRYSQRVSVDCSVILAGENVVAEGHALDLSLPGCLLVSSKRMYPGEYIQLQLFLPDQQPPVHVTLAAIRWVDGFKFGTEFIRTSRIDQDRLDEFMRRHPAYDGSATRKVWPALAT